MAEYSLSMQVIKRSAGRSVIAAAAYRAGERLYDARQDITHDYSRRSGVEHTEMLLPDNAPDWVRGIGREQFWNRVDRTERRKDSQTAREVRIMIPREVPPAQRIALVRDFVRASFVAHGAVADVAWHNKIASDGLEQPHAHCMLTMRPLTEEGFGLKSRHEWVPDPEGHTHSDGRPVMVEDDPDSWNAVGHLLACRENWERIANKALADAGSEARIDRRSLLERGLARLPEPALRLAWYMRDLYGGMRERFGQFQMARHYRAVEERAKTAFRTMDAAPANGTDAARRAERYFGWFDRQLARMEPERPTSPQQTPDLER